MHILTIYTEYIAQKYSKNKFRRSKVIPNAVTSGAVNGAATRIWKVFASSSKVAIQLKERWPES